MLVGRPDDLTRLLMYRRYYDHGGGGDNPGVGRRRRLDQLLRSRVLQEGGREGDCFIFGAAAAGIDIAREREKEEMAGLTRAIVVIFCAYALGISKEREREQSGIFKDRRVLTQDGR